MTFECPSSRMSYRKHIVAFYILNLFFQLLSFDWGFNPFTLKEIADRKDLTCGILFLVFLDIVSLFVSFVSSLLLSFVLDLSRGHIFTPFHFLCVCSIDIFFVVAMGIPSHIPKL